jgi:hypothetical protein
MSNSDKFWCSLMLFFVVLFIFMVARTILITQEINIKEKNRLRIVKIKRCEWHVDYKFLWLGFIPIWEMRLGKEKNPDYSQSHDGDIGSEFLNIPLTFKNKKMAQEYIKTILKLK